MEEAVKEFERACTLEGSAVHYNNMGLALFHNAIRDEHKPERKADLLKQALDAFKEAETLNTHGDPTIFFNRGNVYLHQGKTFEAIEDYQRASDIAPQNPKYHHAKGLAYENKAAEIEKSEQGKYQRFDLDELEVDQRCSNSLQSYLRPEYLE